jgi:hypothetical protein
MLLAKLGKMTAVFLVAFACCGLGYVGYVRVALGQSANPRAVAETQDLQAAGNRGAGEAPEVEDPNEDPKSGLPSKKQMASWRQERDRDKRSVQELMDARVDAAKKALEARLDKFVRGQVTADTFITASKRLQDAEMALGLSGEKRLKQLEGHWGYAKTAYELYKTKFEQEKIGPDEFYQIAEHFLEMEIVIAKAKTQKAGEKK